MRKYFLSGEILILTTAIKYTEVSKYFFSKILKSLCILILQFVISSQHIISKQSVKVKI